MRPLRQGLFYWEGEKCIDRVSAFIDRITRDKPRTHAEVENVAYRVASRLVTPIGARASVRSFMRYLVLYAPEDDLIYRGENISEKQRNEKAKQEKEKQRIERMMDDSVEEARKEGRRFEDVISHQWHVRYGMITRHKRMIKRTTKEIQEIKKLSRELKSLVKEQENVE